MTSVVEAEPSRSAMRKVSWRILPLLGLGYLVATMDRVNISFAALQMNADLGFSATVYGLGAGLFFLGYALFEVPSNVLLARFGARRWIARIMITWGLLAAGMMFVRTPLQFYVMRFLLGIAEAGFFPGVVVYLSQWFPSRYRGRAISRFYVSGAVGQILMGAISGALLSLDGAQGFRGWQWLFLAEGMPAALVGLLVLRLLPDSPARATWLSGDERAWIERELARETDAIGEPQTHNVLAAIVHPVVLRLGIFGLLTIGAFVTLTLSIPQLLKDETGLGAIQVGWIYSAGGVLGAIGMLMGGAWADRQGERFSTMLASTATIGIAYLTMALGLGHSAVLVVAAFLVWMFAWTSVTNACVMLWADLLHPRQMGVGGATINTMSQIGAFAMPYAWGVTRDATGSFRAGLFGLATATLAAWLIAYTLARRTRAVASPLAHSAAAG